MITLNTIDQSQLTVVHTNDPKMLVPIPLMLSGEGNFLSGQGGTPNPFPLDYGLLKSNALSGTRSRSRAYLMSSSLIF